MKERVISGVIFAIIGILILAINNPILDTIVVTLLALIGMYEYNHAFKNIGIKPISWVGYLSCLSILFIGNDIISTANKVLMIKLFLPIVIIGSFCYIIMTNLKRTIIDIAVTFFSILYVPFLISFIKFVLLMDNGRLLFMFVIVAAFVSDMAAYFVGRKFGKKKLCKDISPKKTVEGSIAGVLAVVIVFGILTTVYNLYFAMNLPMMSMLLAGLVASIAGQFGDLSASTIKRYCKVKDFGKIMPGHGGILDRFDSIMFVAPIIYLFLNLYI